MIEITRKDNENLDDVVNKLIAYREAGQQACCRFGEHIFYSDSVTMDSAYLAVTGQKREDYYRQQEEGARRMKEARRRALETSDEREARYRRLVAATRVPGEEIEITEENVVAGLKFILENSHLSHEKMVLGLLMLDCNFTFEDIERQFTEEEIDSDLYESLREGRLVAGAGVIANVRDTEYGRAKLKESLEGLVVDYIRKVTGDESYGNGDGAYTGGGAKK